MKPRKFSITVYNRTIDQTTRDDNNGKGYMVNKACSKLYNLTKKTLSAEQFEYFNALYPLMVKGLAFSNVRAYSINSSDPDITLEIRSI